MNRFLYVLIIASVCFSTLPSSAEVYQWTDEQGVQHFSDVPPEGDVAGNVEETAEIPYDAKADEAREAHDKVVMDKIMNEEAQENSAFAGQTDMEAQASPSDKQSQDAAPEVIYEEGDEGVDRDVLGINKAAENAPERNKEMEQAEKQHQEGDMRPRTERSDDVLGTNEPAENPEGGNAVEHHHGGHGGKR